MKMFGVVTGGLILTATVGGVLIYRRRRAYAAEAQSALDQYTAKVARDAKAVGVDTVARLMRAIPNLQQITEDVIARTKRATLSAVPDVQLGLSAERAAACGALRSRAKTLPFAASVWMLRNTGC